MSAAKRKPTLADTLNQAVTQASRDYNRSIKLRKRDWDEGRKLAHGIVNGVLRHAHGRCVDFVATADELVESGLALPSWFIDSKVCKGVIFDGREIELYRPLLDEPTYELSIPYRRTKGDHG